MKLPDSVWGALCSAGIIFLTQIVIYCLQERSKWVDRRFSEQSRFNDLYKTVYPEKFKSAREFMETASLLYRSLHAYAATYSLEMVGKKSASEFFSEAQRLVYQAHSLEWLLGSRFVSAAKAFQNSCDIVARLVRNADDLPIQDAVEMMGAAYESLVQTLREQLSLPEIENALTIKKERILPRRNEG